MRDLTLNQLRALERQERYGLFYYCDHPGGEVFTFSGTGAVKDKDDRTWLGVADIVEISGSDLTTEISIGEITIVVSGIPAHHEWMLALPVRGAQANLYFGYIDRNDHIIDDLIPIKEYELQNASFTATQETLTYTMSGVPGILQVRSPTRALWSTEYQKDEYPNDTGFNFVEIIQETNVIWAQGALR